MNDIYFWIGIIVFWACCSISVLFVVGFLGKLILDELGKIFKFWWRLVEFWYYRNDFKEFIKDKTRHPKAK